jgi:hypothetical protein
MGLRALRGIHRLGRALADEALVGAGGHAVHLPARLRLNGAQALRGGGAELPVGVRVLSGPVEVALEGTYVLAARSLPQRAGRIRGGQRVARGQQGEKHRSGESRKRASHEPGYSFSSRAYGVS